MNSTTVPSPTMENAELEDTVGRSDIMFTVVWVSFCIFFLSIPFCSTERKRKLCLRRIRERRWIQDTSEDDWYFQMMRDRQARRQDVQTIHQILQITKTQEDEIREQYVMTLLEHYTMMLSKSDIYASSKLDDNASAVDPIEKDDDVSATTDLTTNQSSEQGSEIVDVEAPPPPPSKETKSSDTALRVEGEYEGLKEMDICDTDEFIYVPMPGVQVGESSKEEQDTTAPSDMQRRQAPSGCAICLSSFLVGEKISWSSNEHCSHVFHHDCLLRWFQALGRKTQTKQLERRLNISEAEALEMLFKFPKLCPCCRQTFCVEIQVDVKEEMSEMLERPDGDEHLSTTSATAVMVASEAETPPESVHRITHT